MYHSCAACHALLHHWTELTADWSLGELPWQPTEALVGPVEHQKKNEEKGDTTIKPLLHN